MMTFLPPVARYSSIRSVLAIANELNLNVHQMDVKAAFLNGELDNEIYMKQPEKYVNKEHLNYVCKLNKSLYGLKQATLRCNLTVDKFLKSEGYNQSPADECIYIKLEERDGKQCIMIIAVYVNNTVLASNNDEMLESENQSSDILQHSQNRPTGDRWLKSKIRQSRS